MKLSTAQLRQLAALARLDLDDGQLRALENDFARMMAMAEQIQQAPAEGLDGLSHVHGHGLPLRADEEAAAGPNLAAGAVEHRDGMVVVPPVID